MESQLRILHEGHPSVLQSTITLARVRNTQERFVEAGELSDKAVTEGGRTLGSEHPMVLAATSEQVRALVGQDRLAEAERLAPAIYSARAERLGETHPDTIRALEVVIGIYEAMGHDLEASEYRALREAVAKH